MMNNRELKFRVWDAEKNQFFNLKNAMVIGLGGDIILMTDKGPYPYPVSGGKDRFIIQQYTGLKDKNSKEIYEGDIVVHDYISHSYIYGKHTITNFEIFPFLCLNKLIYGLKRFGEQPIYNIWVGNEIEIIGNIFENPELLK